MLPDNVAETATLKDALKRLEARTPPCDTRPVVVFDAGISSQENLDWLRGKGYDWITVRRNGRADVPKEPAGAEFETRSGRAAEAEDHPPPPPLPLVASHAELGFTFRDHLGQDEFNPLPPTALSATSTVHQTIVTPPSR